MNEEIQVNVPIVSGRFLLRILLSPIILALGFLLTCCLMVFPLPLLCGVTFFQLIAYPFILLFNIAGAEIEIPEPFVNDISKSYLVGYFLTLTLPIWGMFAITVYFLLTGKVWTLED